MSYEEITCCDEGVAFLEREGLDCTSHKTVEELRWKCVNGLGKLLRSLSLDLTSPTTRKKVRTRSANEKNS